jgi:hypothetical protein
LLTTRLVAVSVWLAAAGDLDHIQLARKAAEVDRIRVDMQAVIGPIAPAALAWI